MQIPPSVKRKRRKNPAAYVDPLAPAPTGDKPMGKYYYYYRSVNHWQRLAAHVAIADELNKKLRSHSIDRCVSQAR